MLVRCLQQRQSGSMAQAAANSLLHLVKETGASFNQDTWASVCAELKSCFDSGDAPPIDEVAPPVDSGTTPSPLLREVSAKVEAEAPPGSGPHELQVLLLSTVYQLLQSMYPSMKLGDVEGLLNCMHSMYDKSHRALQAALFDSPPRPIDEEALHMQLEKPPCQRWCHAGRGDRTCGAWAATLRSALLVGCGAANHACGARVGIIGVDGAAADGGHVAAWHEDPSAARRG